MDRVKTLQEFIAAQPKDPFPRYGLAMEFKNAGRLEDARESFAELAEMFPTYVATYLMYGNTLAELGQKDEALKIYEAGIEVASQAGDGHTRGELEAALAEIRS